MMHKITNEQFLEKCHQTHGYTYDYSKTQYTSMRKNVIITCRVHGDFEQKAFFHSTTGSGCPLCARIKITNDGFIRRAKTVHGDRYDYSKTEYQKMKKTVDVICSDHGLFSQVAETHLDGSGCPKCSGRHLTWEEFIESARDVHGDTYEYDQESFKSTDSHVKVLCSSHGYFQSNRNRHLKGTGFFKCGSIRATIFRTKTLEDFIADARKIHGDKYDYREVKYISTNHRVRILCPSHGAFLQAAASHLSGRCCPKCKRRISKGETSWLDSLGVKVRQFKILLSNRTVFVDGYDDETKTIYEYYGDYWHGNIDRFPPDKINPHAKISFKTLNEKTLAREKEIAAAGYQVVSMWESNWDKILKNARNH